MSRHAGATHDDHVRAVAVAQCAADLDHAIERLLAARRLGNAHVERPLAREPRLEPHLPQVTQMPPHGGLSDGNDPETVSAGKGSKYTALVDAEYGLARRLAADGETRIGVAGDDEGIRVVGLGDQRPERHGDAVDVGLRLDTDRPFRKRDACNLGARIQAERLERFVYPVCDERVGVRIDDEDPAARAQGVLQLPVARDVDYHCDAQKALARGA